MKRYAIQESKEVSKYHLHEAVSMQTVINKVADHFKLIPDQILKTEPGAGKKNIPRRMAIYLCKQHTGATLMEIAEYFNVGHYSTISQTIQRFANDLKTDRASAKALNVLSQDLTP